MSILSRLFQRSPEDGSPTTAPSPTEIPSQKPEKPEPAPAAKVALRVGTQAGTGAGVGVGVAEAVPLPGLPPAQPPPGGPTAAPPALPVKPGPRGGGRETPPPPTPAKVPPRPLKTTSYAAVPDRSPSRPAPQAVAATGAAPKNAAAAVATGGRKSVAAENPAPVDLLSSSESIDRALAKLVPPNGVAAASPTTASPTTAPPMTAAAAAADAPGVAAAAATQPGISTPADRAAVLATFEDLAVMHVAQIRNLMLEVRWGEALTRWIDLARPSLKSLRAMAGQLGSDELTAALDGFDAGLETVLQPGGAATVVGAAREALLAAYQPLVACMPRAFELGGERDRREPLIVMALLQLALAPEPLALEKVLAAGLARLEALFSARPDEIAAVSGISVELATGLVYRVQEFRRTTPAALSTPDAPETRRQLETLLSALVGHHRAFEEAAVGWSESSAGAKKRHRHQREVCFLEVKIALARMGDVDLVGRLEKLSFANRIDALERHLRHPGLPPAAAAPTGRPSTAGAHPNAPTAP